MQKRVNMIAMRSKIMQSDAILNCFYSKYTSESIAN